MGKPKRAPGTTSASARAASSSAAAAASAWWNNPIGDGSDRERDHSQVAGDDQPRQSDWSGEEEGDWFFIEIVREMPMLVGIFIRCLLRLNRNYWLHVWIFAGGWETGTSAVEACDLCGQSVKYAYGAMAALMFYFWQPKMLPLVAPFSFGFLLRFLYLSVGGLYAFIFFGVTQAPFLSFFGEKYPAESDMLERAMTPFFIAGVIFMKHLNQAGLVFPGVYEPHHPDQDCVWFPILVSDC